MAFAAESIDMDQAGDEDEIDEVVFRTDKLDDVSPSLVRVPRKRLKPQEREYIWAKSGQRCYICKDPLERNGRWHIEHVLAFSLDPTKNDVMGNMLASCPNCNHKKLNRPLTECVNDFAWNLDSGAAMASHLNTDARCCLLEALEKKHELFKNFGATPFLDEIEERIRVSAENLLPGGEFEVNEREIGRGTFGVVYRAKWRKNGQDEPQVVAVKFPNAVGSQLLGREQEALRELCNDSHKHLVRFYGLVRYCWPDTAPPCVQCGIVMEFCDYDIGMISVLKNGDLTRLISQAAEGLAYMHSKNYIHRDVKFPNILILKRDNMAWRDAMTKLSDFGSAKKIIQSVDGEEQIHTRGEGTGMFRAPETRNGEYFPASDMYSLGKTMEYLKRSGKSKIFATRSKEHEEWIRVEKGCVHPDPNRRLTADQVRQMLSGDLTNLGQLTIQSPRSPKWKVTPVTDKPKVAATGKNPDAAASHSPQRSVVETITISGFEVPESPETVFVHKNARTKVHVRGDLPTRCGMKYHFKKGCHGGTIEINLEDAERFRHTPCGKCC